MTRYSVQPRDKKSIGKNIGKNISNGLSGKSKLC